MVVLNLSFAVALIKLYLFFLQTIYKISFGQIYLSKPMMTESDGETATLFPKAARLRNLTYSAPLYVDVSKRVIKKGHDGEEVTETQDFTKVFIGKVRQLFFSSSCIYYIYICGSDNMHVFFLFDFFFLLGSHHAPV